MGSRAIVKANDTASLQTAGKTQLSGAKHAILTLEAWILAMR